jgi:hypothetical protein
VLVFARRLRATLRTEGRTLTSGRSIGGGLPEASYAVDGNDIYYGSVQGNSISRVTPPPVFE